MRYRSGFPTLEASLRVLAEGGRVKDAVDDDDFLPIQQELNGGTAKGLILLVHGYNNTRQAASDAYEGFFARQKEIADLPANRPLADNKLFVEVFWPGDADWGFASFLFYMGAVTNAKLTGERFAAFLRRVAGRAEPLDVQVVGHSLGCRVVFEFIRHLIGAAGVRVTHVVFMAAAVPLSLLEEPADEELLRHAFDQVMARSQGAARSLFSPDDIVLTGAFPAGQSLAKGREGLMPVALGRDFWQALVEPARFSQYQVRGANHSDYWGWNTDKLAQGKDAQRQVHQFLGFNAAGDRRIVGRDPGAREIEGREAMATRTVDTRPLPQAWQP